MTTNNITNDFSNLTNDSAEGKLAHITCAELVSDADGAVEIVNVESLASLETQAAAGDCVAAAAARIGRASVKLAGMPARFIGRVSHNAMLDLHSAIRAECEASFAAIRAEEDALAAL